MITIEMLKLTDDEVCAIALQYDGVLRPPLPTIDESSQAELAAGVLRGRRSLVARDLADADGTPIGDAFEVFKCLSGGPRAMFAFVDANGDWFRAGFTAYLYGSSVTDVEMSQTVADAGLHYFRLVPPPGQWQALALLAESIYADGFADPAAQRGRERPAAALLHVVRPDGIRSIRVARGTATTGRGPVPAQFPSIPQAIAWLLA
jgi:hypothetical protein